MISTQEATLGDQGDVVPQTQLRDGHVLLALGQNVDAVVLRAGLAAFHDQGFDLARARLLLEFLFQFLVGRRLLRLVRRFPQHVGRRRCCSQAEA